MNRKLKAVVQTVLFVALIGSLISLCYLTNWKVGLATYTIISLHYLLAKDEKYYLISFDYKGDKRMFIDKLVKAENLDEAIDKIKSKYPLATEFINHTITEW